MSDVVLDASALLALLNSEPGADKVSEAVPLAAICAVNLSEVITKLSREGVPEEIIRQTVQALPFEVVSFDEEQAYQTGLLQASTKAFGLSLGDRACLSLAKTLGAVALTADQAWAGLSIGVTVEVIRADKRTLF